MLDTGSNVATVVGFADDQADGRAAVHVAARPGHPGDAPVRYQPSHPVRGRTARRSCVAYAARIGQRLREASAATVSEAVRAHGEGLLPVLRSREVAVEDQLAEAFPHLRRMRVTASDPAGYAAGHAAAERARLGGEEVRGRVRRLPG